MTFECLVSQNFGNINTNELLFNNLYFIENNKTDNRTDTYTQGSAQFYPMILRDKPNLLKADISLYTIPTGRAKPQFLKIKEIQPKLDLL